MIICCEPESGSVTMREPDVFTGFHVETPEGADLAAVSVVLGTPPCDQPDHVWVRVAHLAELAGEPAPEWHESLAGMLGYAQSKGWMNDDGDLIMAHVESAPSAA